MPLLKVDPKIMQELLDQPGVKENVAQMTPETLEWFKEYLVKQGIYAKFVTERQAAQIKAMMRGKREP